MFLVKYCFSVNSHFMGSSIMEILWKMCLKNKKLIFFSSYSFRLFGLFQCPTEQIFPCCWRQRILLANLGIRLSGRFQPSTTKEQEQCQTPRNSSGNRHNSSFEMILQFSKVYFQDFVYPLFFFFKKKNFLRKQMMY